MHVISSFLTALMSDQAKAKPGHKTRKFSQNVMLVVTVSTMAYSLKQWKMEWVQYHFMKNISTPCGGNCNS